MGKICEIGEDDLKLELWYHGIDPRKYNFSDEDSISSARDDLRNERQKMCSLENITMFDKDQIQVLNSQSNHSSFWKEM